MLDEWLEHSQRSDGSFEFNVNDISEKEGRDTDKINEVFGKIILDNTVGYDTAKKISAIIGWDDTFEKFISPRLSKNINMKKGKFGEMLESEALEEFFDFVIPIKKWRYAITSDQSLLRTDIIAIKKNDSEITEMSFVESKLTATDGKRIVLKAYEQLMEDRDKGFSEILDFIISRLYEEKNPLADMFLEYCFKKDRPNDTYRVSVTYDTDKWDDKSLENLNEVMSGSMSELSIDVIRIKTLETIVNEVYKKRGWIVIE